MNHQRRPAGDSAQSTGGSTKRRTFLCGAYLILLLVEVLAPSAAARDGHFGFRFESGARTASGALNATFPVGVTTNGNFKTIVEDANGKAVIGVTNDGRRVILPAYVTSNGNLRGYLIRLMFGDTGSQENTDSFEGVVDDRGRVRASDIAVPGANVTAFDSSFSKKDAALLVMKARPKRLRLPALQETVKTQAEAGAPERGRLALPVQVLAYAPLQDGSPGWDRDNPFWLFSARFYVRYRTVDGVRAGRISVRLPGLNLEALPPTPHRAGPEMTF